MSGSCCVSKWSLSTTVERIFKQKTKLDPDEKWSNLHREHEKNILYKWCGLKTGEMHNIFDSGGEEGILRFYAEKIKPLLYSEGESTAHIKLSDFVKYKNDQRINLAGVEDANDVNGFDSVANFEEHVSQWKLNRRGVEGETVVHLLYGRCDARSTEIARILLNECPGLALDIFEGDYKYGQSCLHLAIVHDNFAIVNFLLSKNVSVNQRARGNFFLPDDMKDSTSNSEHTSYVGYAYYGEYPLAFAASFGNKDIYDALIDKGADPNLQDQFGNTVLHICVINNSIEMYSYAVRHFRKPANVNILNGAGYTPLTLASKLGRKLIFDQMLEIMKVEFWRFSDLAYSAYPLSALDTTKPDGSTNWDSALMTIINGDTDEHLDMVDGEIIQRLLGDKWKAYARGKLYQRLAMVLLYIVTLCIAVYLRGANDSILYTYFHSWDISVQVPFCIRSAAEVFVCLQCLNFLLIQPAGEIRSQGFHGFLRNLKNAPSKCIFLVGNVCILLCIPCRVLGITRSEARLTEDLLLMIGLPCSWVFLLFFARSTRLTGPFVQMIYQMIAGDMVRFCIITLIFLLCYVQVFFFVGKGIKESDEASEECSHYANSTDFKTLPNTAITMFRAMMGGFDFEELECTRYRTLTKLLFLFYMVTMPIMLINMLIAMMGNTYTTVVGKAEKAWKKNLGQIIIVLERSLKRAKLAAAQLEYSVKLADAKNDGLEIRGLMVIKQTRKTSAQQRKEAVANWKRLGRKVAATIAQKRVHQSFQPQPQPYHKVVTRQKWNNKKAENNSLLSHLDNDSAKSAKNLPKTLSQMSRNLPKTSSQMDENPAPKRSAAVAATSVRQISEGPFENDDSFIEEFLASKTKAQQQEQQQRQRKALPNVPAQVRLTTGNYGKL